MRRLSPEEAALWRRFTHGVAPLHARPPGRGEGGHLDHREGQPPASPIAAPDRAVATPKSAGKAGALALPRAAASAERRSVSPNSLDGSWERRIGSGRLEPDMTIDLHGETLASAHAHLNRSLDAAIRRGVRVVLLITGRPAKDNPRLPPTSRGVIRASVMDWLAASSHSGRIAAIRGAHPRHGGAGALYLILRRAR